MDGFAGFISWSFPRWPKTPLLFRLCHVALISTQLRCFAIFIKDQEKINIPDMNHIKNSVREMNISCVCVVCLWRDLDFILDSKYTVSLSETIHQPVAFYEKHSALFTKFSLNKSPLKEHYSFYPANLKLTGWPRETLHLHKSSCFSFFSAGHHEQSLKFINKGLLSTLGYYMNNFTSKASQT